jgi:hypothetical protein
MADFGLFSRLNRGRHKEEGECHEGKEQDKSRRMAYDPGRPLMDKGASFDAPDPSPICSSAGGS